MKSHGIWAVGVVACLSLLPSVARAEDDSWRFSITPYLWLPSANTTFDLSGEPIEINTSTEGADVFDNLDFAFLAMGEVRKGRIGLIYDFQYLKLSGDGSVDLANEPEFDMKVTFADSTLALGYRVVDEDKLAVTAVGGARIIWADIDVDIEAGPNNTQFSGSDDKAWVDPIVGALIRYRFDDKWGLNLYGDIGGFGVGSDLTYTLIGTVSYNFNENFAIQGGWRYWSVDYDNDDFTFDVALQGPVLGLTFVF